MENNTHTSISAQEEIYNKIKPLNIDIQTEEAQGSLMMILGRLTDEEIDILLPELRVLGHKLEFEDHEFEEMTGHNLYTWKEEAHEKEEQAFAEYESQQGELICQTL